MPWISGHAFGNVTLATVHTQDRAQMETWPYPRAPADAASDSDDPDCES